MICFRTQLPLSRLMHGRRRARMSVACSGEGVVQVLIHEGRENSPFGVRIKNALQSVEGKTVFTAEEICVASRTLDTLLLTSSLADAQNTRCDLP